MIDGFRRVDERLDRVGERLDRVDARFARIAGAFDQVDNGFAETRAKFDITTAGQQRIVDLIRVVIDAQGGEGSA